MSCITVIGRHRYYEAGCDDKLPMTLPEWSASKQRRMASFSTSKSPRLRAVAAAHPLTHKGVLGRMMLDPDVGVRRAAIKNPNATDAMISVALVDPDPGIAAFARLLRMEETDD